MIRLAGEMNVLEPQVVASRRLRAKTVPATPAGCSLATTTFTQPAPVAIPTGPDVVTSTLVVSGAGPCLFDVDVTTFISHTFAADLDVTITSPAGTVVTLTTDDGARNDDVFNGTVWDDDASNDTVTDHVDTNLTLTWNVGSLAWARPRVRPRDRPCSPEVPSGFHLGAEELLSAALAPGCAVEAWHSIRRRGVQEDASVARDVERGEEDVTGYSLSTTSAG